MVLMTSRRRFTGWDLASLVAGVLGVLALSLTSMSIDEKFHDPSNPVANRTLGLPLASFDGWHWSQLSIPAFVVVAAAVLLLAWGAAPHVLSRIPLGIDVLVPVVMLIATFAELNRGLTYPAAVSYLTKRAIGPGTWLVVIAGFAATLCAVKSQSVRRRPLPVAEAPAIVDLTQHSAVTETREFEPVADRGPVLQGEVIDVRGRWRGQRV
jgi:hypothetical protein